MLKVSLAILFNEREVLLIQRESHKPHGGTWFFPGGKVEEGEGLREAARRELEEEMGIVEDELVLVGKEEVEGAVNYYFMAYREDIEGVELKDAYERLRSQATSKVAPAILRELLNISQVISKVQVSSSSNVVRVFFSGCNWKCIFCDKDLDYLYSSPFTAYSSLSLGEFLRMAKSASFLSLLGGEPTLYHFHAYLANLSAFHNHTPTVITNGSLLGRWLDVYDERVNIRVSVRDWKEERHVRLTSAPLKPVFDNLRKAMERGFSVSCETILMPPVITPKEVGLIAKRIAAISPYLPLRVDAYYTVPNAPFREPTVEELLEAVEEARKHLVFVDKAYGKIEEDMDVYVPYRVVV